jgi:hypothetical protein
MDVDQRRPNRTRLGTPYIKGASEAVFARSDDSDCSAAADALSSRRTCIIVCGMHRTGTSAAARVVSLLGADLPKDLVSPKADVRGYWEPRAVVRVHNQLLEALGTSSADPLPLPRDWLELACTQQAKAKLVGIIESEFSESRLFVVKDPRIPKVLRPPPKQDAERAYRRLVDHRSSGGYELAESDNRVIEAKKVLAKASDDFERVKQRTGARSQAWQAISGALSNVENWLRFGLPGNCQIEPIQIEVPKPGKDGLLDQIEVRRRRVREIKASIHTIQSSCFPSSYCKERLRETVEQLAARGMPDVSSLIEYDQDVAWPMQRVSAQVHGADQRSLAFHEAVDVVGLLAFLLKPAMISALDALVDAEKDDKNSLSHEARQLREAEAMGDLLAVERQEAALVWQAQSENLPAEHRSDCAPQAILQCRLLVAPRADASGTTAGISWDLRR